MTRRFSTLVLVGSVLGVTGCDDSVPLSPEPADQGQSLSTAEAELPVFNVTAGDVEPTLATLEYYDDAYQSYSLSVARKTWFTLTTLDYPEVLGVPKFNPALGELHSAQLIIDGGLAGRMISHALGPYYVSSTYDLSFTAGLGGHPIAGEPPIQLTVGWRGSHSLARFIPDPYISRTLDDYKSYGFNQTYTGADAEQFIALYPGSRISFSQTAGRFLHASATHSGLALGNFLSIANEPPIGQTKPGLFTLVTVVATIINDSDGHGLFTFSDLHGAGAAFFSIRVRYQYYPFTDTDQDGIPNVDDPDDDNDGVTDEKDAFPLDATEWSDIDGDGIGDNADPDDDNDGQSDDDEITCGSDPLDAASISLDTDGDGWPNCVDDNDDNDGALDVDDAFPLDPSETSDNDGDRIGDNADLDDDNDGQSDDDEAVCGTDPLDASSISPDWEGDGRPDCADPDDDNDGVNDEDDRFPRSDIRPTVVVGGYDSGVTNQGLDDGATFNDLIGECGLAAGNHGQFTSCVSRLTNEWKTAGLITGEQKGSIQQVAAHGGGHVSLQQE